MTDESDSWRSVWTGAANRLHRLVEGDSCRKAHVRWCCSTGSATLHVTQVDDGDLDKVYLASCSYQSYIAANRCVTSSLCTLETAVFDKGKKAKYVASKVEMKKRRCLYHCWLQDTPEATEVEWVFLFSSAVKSHYTREYKWSRRAQYLLWLFKSEHFGVQEMLIETSDKDHIWKKMTLYMHCTGKEKKSVCLYLKKTSDGPSGRETSSPAPGGFPLPESVIKTWPFLVLISLCLNPCRLLPQTGPGGLLQQPFEFATVCVCVCVLIHKCMQHFYLHASSPENAPFFFCICPPIKMFSLLWSQCSSQFMSLTITPDVLMDHYADVAAVFILFCSSTRIVSSQRDGDMKTVDSMRAQEVSVLCLLSPPCIRCNSMF